MAKIDVHAFSFCFRFFLLLPSISMIKVDVFSEFGIHGGKIIKFLLCFA